MTHEERRLRSRGSRALGSDIARREGMDHWDQQLVVLLMACSPHNKQMMMKTGCPLSWSCIDFPGVPEKVRSAISPHPFWRILCS